MGQRRFSDDETNEIISFVDGGGLPPAEWDVIHVSVKGDVEGRSWTAVVRNTRTARSYRLHWARTDDGELALVDFDAIEVIPCMVVSRTGRVPFSMRFIEA